MEREKNKKSIYLIILVTFILSVNVIPRLFPNVYRVIVFGIWFIGFLLTKLNQKKVMNPKNLKEKTIYLTLILIAYYIIYFALGIILGFSNNPYPINIINVLKNIGFVIGARIAQEYIRANLVNKKNSKFDFAIIVLIFATFDINFRTALSNMTDIAKSIEYVAGILLPAVARSAILTFLSKVGGFKLSVIFSVAYYGIEFITPILPSFDWFVVCAKDLLLCLTIYLFINNIYITKTLRMSKRDSKKYNPMNSVPAVIILILFVSFMVGVFDYKPIAVMSYSMYPEFSRGDVLIVKTIDKEKPGAIKVGDIIQYQLDGRFIVHRVVEIKIDYTGKFSFITKGDNNNANDSKPVDISQVDGVAKFIVPYVGYPSVWFSQFVLNKQPVVETE